MYVGTSKELRGTQSTELIGLLGKRKDRDVDKKWVVEK